MFGRNDEAGGGVTFESECSRLDALALSDLAAEVFYRCFTTDFVQRFGDIADAETLVREAIPSHLRSNRDDRLRKLMAEGLGVLVAGGLLMWMPHDNLVAPTRVGRHALQAGTTAAVVRATVAWAQ